MSPHALFGGSEMAAYSNPFFSNVERIALALEDKSLKSACIRLKSCQQSQPWTSPKLQFVHVQSGTVIEPVAYVDVRIR